MLSELAVENFALVEKLRLRFEPGLNLLTGETGAGKSILLDALGMVLGERTSSDSVRHGADKARVEAVFTLDETDVRLKEVMEAAGIETEDGLLIWPAICPRRANRRFASTGVRQPSPCSSRWVMPLWTFTGSTPINLCFQSSGTAIFWIPGADRK